MSVQSKVPVVIDPRLCKVLRPHQVEGVKVWVFLRFSGQPRSRLCHIVLVPMHNWDGCGESIRLYYG